jgi:hypothetical protein
VPPRAPGQNEEDGGRRAMEGTMGDGVWWCGWVDIGGRSGKLVLRGGGSGGHSGRMTRFGVCRCICCGKSGAAGQN